MPAASPAPKTAYDLTVGVVINMDEAIYMLSPDDTPLLTGMGADGLSVLGSNGVDEVQFSWMTDSLLLPRSIVTGGVLTTGDTIITVATGDQAKFSTGDVIKIVKAGIASGAEETARVTGYGTTADTLLVSRALAGTATNYASGAVIIGLGTALPEGYDPETARVVDRVEATNVTQIFGPTLVHLSATEQIVRKYGVANEFAHQTMGRMKENAISREGAILYGRRTNNSSTKIRTMGGLVQYLTTNINVTATQLTVPNIQTGQQTCYNAGGLFDRLIANPVAMADLNDVGNTSIVRVELTDPRRGRMRALMVDTEFGSLTLVRDRWCAGSDAFGIRRDGVIRRPMRPLTLERLAKTGDSDKAQIVCEEGLEVKSQEHMIYFNNLGYTGYN